MSVHNVESENQNVSHPNASVEDINEQNIQQSSPAVRATDGSSCSASDTCEVSREQRDATITANQLPSTSRGSAEYPRDSPHNYSNEELTQELNHQSVVNSYVNISSMKSLLPQIQHFVIKNLRARENCDDTSTTIIQHTSRESIEGNHQTTDNFTHGQLEGNSLNRTVLFEPPNSIQLKETSTDTTAAESITQSIDNGPTTTQASTQISTIIHQTSVVPPSYEDSQRENLRNFLRIPGINCQVHSEMYCNVVSPLNSTSEVEIRITPPPVPPRVIRGPPPLAGAPPSYSAVMRIGSLTEVLLPPSQRRREVQIQPSPPFIAPIPPPSYAETEGYYMDSAVASVEQTVWGPEPIAVVCPRCATIVMTSTESHRSNLTHFSALLLCLCGCWPCCLLPYCMDSCKNTYHHCPSCQQYLGMYRPW